jgi:hypothetical protein
MRGVQEVADTEKRGARCRRHLSTLVTAVTGLIIAIPALAAFAIFAARSINWFEAAYTACMYQKRRGRKAAACRP